MAGISSANGAQLQLGSLGSPQTFTAVVAFIADISGFGIQSSKIDTSNHNDTDGFESFIMGLKSPGEVGFKIFWDPANSTHNGTGSQGLWDIAGDQTLRQWRITDSRGAGTYFWFSAYVMKITHSKPVNGAQAADCTLAISGAIHHSTES